MASTPEKQQTAIYELSTQFKNWRFSSTQLSRMRRDLNVAAVSAIKKTLDSVEPGSSTGISFINSDEELLLVKLYMTKIPQLCALFRFPEEVDATAVSFLKRFYLKNTVMDWHPKNIMLTTLFLASKTTNNPISLEAYANRIPKTLPSDVLDNEFLVAQSIGFDFAVHHAHRAWYGLWLDLQSLPDVPDASTELYDNCLKRIRASRLTDAELIYTPSQIALGALSMCDYTLALKWAESKVPSDSVDILKSVMESIRVMITSSGHPPDVESVREVDRRLKLCKNPEKIPGTKAYLKKQAEEAQKEQEKKDKKVEEIQRAFEENDPFGNENDPDRKRAQEQALAAIDEDDD